MHRTFIISILIISLLLIMLFIRRADIVSDLVNSGNAAYLAGDYDMALSVYTEASGNAPESPHLYYNKGTALYKNGDYSTASEALKKSIVKSRSPWLAAMSYFSLGNCIYKEVQGQQDSDPKGFVDACIISINCYQETLRIDPDFIEAAENIEVVRLEMKNILDMINEKKEKTKQPRNSKERIEEIKDLIKKQQDALAQNRKLDTGQDNERDSTKQNKQIQELARNQKKMKTQTESLVQNIRKPGEKNNQLNENPTFKHLKRAAKEQNEASRKLEKNNTSDAAANQENALRELKKAYSSLDLKQDKQTTEKIKKLMKKQQEALDKNKDLDSRQGSKNDSPEIRQQMQELARDQKNLRTSTEELTQNMSKPGEMDTKPSSESPAEKHLENAAREQNEALGNLNRNNGTDAATHQEKALKELKKALSFMLKERDGGDQKHDQPDSDQKKKDEKSAPLYQFNEDSKDILNEERINRRQGGMGDYEEVDKDW